MKKVRAVIARPKEEAHIEYITPELSTLQKIVEGTIELAIMADECTVSAISHRLDEVARGNYDINKIRENAYQTGVENFSMEAYKESLYAFLNTNR